MYQFFVFISDINPPWPLVCIPGLDTGNGRPTWRGERKLFCGNQVPFMIPIMMNDGGLDHLVELRKTGDSAQTDGKDDSLIGWCKFLNGLAHDCLDQCRPCRGDRDLLTPRGMRSVEYKSQGSDEAQFPKQYFHEYFTRSPTLSGPVTASDYQNFPVLSWCKVSVKTTRSVKKNPENYA